MYLEEASDKAEWEGVEDNAATTPFLVLSNLLFDIEAAIGWDANPILSALLILLVFSDRPPSITAVILHCAAEVAILHNVCIVCIYFMYITNCCSNICYQVLWVGWVLIVLYMCIYLSTQSHGKVAFGPSDKTFMGPTWAFFSNIFEIYSVVRIFN